MAFCLAIFAGSCQTIELKNYGNKISNQNSTEIVDFTKNYRQYLSDKELLEHRDATFLNKEEIQLLGVPATKNSIYFKESYLMEDSWKHIVVPAGTLGKAVRVSSSRIETIFSQKDTVMFTWMEFGEDYLLIVKRDPAPKIPPGILEKYRFTQDFQYIDYLGSKFYLLEGRNENKLQVRVKKLEPTKIEMQGIK
ncbi:MAG: hypothetical protein NTX85_02580 [Candidatus Nomurabacteria bacterium]|nr:hypothetical protein [Candidatus Nomurabacteria bacterium]